MCRAPVGQSQHLWPPPRYRPRNRLVRGVLSVASPKTLVRKSPGRTSRWKADGRTSAQELRTSRMKQAVQDLQGGGTRIVEVPIPTAGRGQVVVRTAFSLISSGTERMVAEFAGKTLAGKARARPDLVRQTLDKARREGVLAAAEAVRQLRGRCLCHIGGHRPPRSAVGRGAGR